MLFEDQSRINFQDQNSFVKQLRDESPLVIFFFYEFKIMNESYLFNSLSVYE